MRNLVFSRRTFSCLDNYFIISLWVCNVNRILALDNLKKTNSVLSHACTKALEVGTGQILLPCHRQASSIFPLTWSSSSSSSCKTCPRTPRLPSPRRRRRRSRTGRGRLIGPSGGGGEGGTEKSLTSAADPKCASRHGFCPIFRYVIQNDRVFFLFWSRWGGHFWIRAKKIGWNSLFFSMQKQGYSKMRGNLNLKIIKLCRECSKTMQDVDVCGSDEIFMVDSAV